MGRVSWGQSFAFGMTAVMVPWVFVAAISATLLLASGESDAVAYFLLPLTAVVAVIAAVIAALITRAWRPLNRLGAGLHTILASVLSFAVVGAVAGAFVAGDFLAPFTIILLFGGGTFLIGGGTPWALAGGIFASRILPTVRVTRPRWAPAGWILVGIAAVIVAVILMTPYLSGDWHWFPLGRSPEGNGGPSWVPTFIFANGLGVIAMGAALWITREPDPGSAPVSSLGSADPAGS